MPSSRDEIRFDELADPLGIVSVQKSDTADERVLQVRADLSAAGSFEFALRERVARLAAFRHPGFVPIHRIERVRHLSRLLVVGSVPSGVRLRDLLTPAAPVPPGWALHVIADLLDSVANLHAVGPDVAHGLIAAERIFVDDTGRVALTDYVFALAIQQLRYSSHRYATELLIPVPADAVTFDQRLDLYQIGTVAKDLLFAEGSVGEQLPTDDLRAWVSQMTQTAPPFRSARQALDALRPLAKACEPVTTLTWATGLVEGRQAAASPAVATADCTVSDSPEPGPRVLDSTPGDELAVCEFADSLAPASHAIPKEPEQDTPQTSTRASWPVAPAATGAPSLLRRWRLTPTSIAVVSVLVVVALTGRARFASHTAAAIRPGTRAAALLKPRGSAAPAPSRVVSAAGSVPEHPQSGTSHVRTDPPGAAVAADGRAVARAAGNAVPPVDHRVNVPQAAGEKERVQRGAATVPVTPLSVTPAQSPRTGWMEIRGPIDAQIFEDGHLIGTTDTPRVMLPQGTHHVEIVNSATGFREPRTIDIAPAGVATLTFDVPVGALAVNAFPWADVWLDGQNLGTTPLGNISASVGRHEVVFRHPSYGEQRRTVVVRVDAVARLSVDFTKGTP